MLILLHQWLFFLTYSPNAKNKAYKKSNRSIGVELHVPWLLLFRCTICTSCTNIFDRTPCIKIQYFNLHVFFLSHKLCILCQVVDFVKVETLGSESEAAWFLFWSLRAPAPPTLGHRPGERSFMIIFCDFTIFGPVFDEVLKVLAALK